MADEAPKRKRGRPSKAEVAARPAAEVAEDVQTEAAPEPRRAPHHMIRFGPEGPKMFKPGEIIPEGYK